MQGNRGCSAASLSDLAGKWMLQWSRNLQWDLLPKSDTPFLSWIAAPYLTLLLIELFYLSVHFIWTLTSSYFLYHIFRFICDSAVCCQTPLCCTRLFDQCCLDQAIFVSQAASFFFALIFRTMNLKPIKLSAISCELKYGIHSISAWNGGMILKCCIFLLWDIQYLEIRSEIEYIYCNYYLSISFGRYPNKKFLIVKQSVGVEWCFHSKGSNCQSRWIKQLIYLN